MASLDHNILKVNDLKTSVSLYTEVMGFALEGTDGPFNVLRAGPAPTLYFNDPNKHLIEIRSYER
jgi:catechol 2,3-dioxygenase-like lactoylglutathione lyase family enzyme